MRWRTFIGAVVLLTTIVGGAEAGQAVQPKSRATLAGADVVIELARTVAKKSADASDENARDSARSAKQVAAPKSTPEGGSVVDAPSFSQIVGLAVDQGLFGIGEGSATVDLNLFAFVVLKNPNVAIRQDHYARFNRIRRLGGAATFGGKGESFDSDGDGKKNDPITAENLTDIVRAEVRWRFLGTRDPREARSLRTYLNRMEALNQELESIVVQLFGPLNALIAKHDAAAADNEDISGPCDPANAGAGRCVFADRLEKLAALVEPHLSGELGGLGKVIGSYEEAHTEAVRAIDHQTVWTAVFTTTRQSEKFGPARLGAEIRGVFSTGVWDHSLNAGWNRADWRQGRPLAHSVKVAYGLSRLLSSDSSSTSAPKLTVAVNVEKFRDVPDAKHDQLVTAGIRVDVPFSEKVSIPISLNYASHSDLLTAKKQLSAHIGLAWDFSGLSKKKP